MALLQASGKDLPDTGPGRLKGLLGRAYGLLTSSEGHGRASRNALIAFMIRVVSAAIAFVSQIIMARMMGQHEYGIFVFVWVLVVLIGNLSCLGFHSAQIRFLPQFEAANDVERIRGLTATARIFALLSSTTVLGLGLVALHLCGGLIEPYYVTPLFIALLVGTILLVGALTFVPALALGPVIEHLTLFSR